jgi:DNA-binding Xre family transcriptional regulator
MQISSMALLLCDNQKIMIRFKLTQRMADLSQKLGKKLSLDDVAQATGIHRTTLSRMNRLEGSNVTTDNLDRLCNYLECELSDLAEYIPSAPPAPRKSSKQSSAE